MSDGLSVFALKERIESLEYKKIETPATERVIARNNAHSFFLFIR